MYFKIDCPHCDKSLKVRHEQAGRRCRCPYCKELLLIPDPSQIGTQEKPPAPPVVNTGGGSGASESVSVPSINVEAPARPRPKSRPAAEEPVAGGFSHSSDGSSVSLLVSGLIGLGAAILIFAILFPLKLQGIRLGTMFWNSVEINFPTTLLMCWSFAILFLKWRQLLKQRSAMMLDLLPTEISPEITPESLDQFVGHIHSLPPDARESMLVNRVLRGIEHFRVRKSAAETVTMMESQSMIDASNVASSYTIVKVFIWAMPILGFIGTVMGVSSAVAGLSTTLEDAANVSAVTESMKGVFGGLGTAFDTTLLALVMSLLVKIPASALQKSEDGLVTVADEYCNENLLRRLNDGREGGAERGGTTAGDAAVFREAVEAAMGTHHAELENWLGRLDAIGSKLTTQVARGWTDINNQMQQQQEQQLAQFQQQTGQHAVMLQQQLQEMNTAAVGIQQALSALTEQAAATQKDVAESVAASSHTLQQHYGALEEGLVGLTNLLDKLNGQRIVVEQTEPARRGWFGFGKKRAADNNHERWK